MIKCQTCGSPSFAGTLFCPECGARLYQGASEITRTLNREEMAGALAEGLFEDNLSGDESETVAEELTLVVSHRTVRLALAEREARTLGRIDKPTQARKPDVDLSAYGAYDKGVSRVHGRFQRVKGRPVFTDLGSANGTFLNGQRLAPNQPVPLRNGDQLKLGKLEATVYFLPAEKPPAPEN